MNVTYFFSLWWRNIKGTFFGGFLSYYDAPSTYLWWGLGHILTMPITVPFGSLIKTLFDIATREYTHDMKLLNSISTLIDNMTETDMENLTTELISQKYTPKSNSSRFLFDRLSTDSQRIEDIQKKDMNTTDVSEENKKQLASLNIPEQKIKLFMDYLGKKYDKDYTDDMKLTHLVKKTLTLNNDSMGHAIELEGLVHLYQILAKPESKPLVSKLGFYSQSTPPNTENKQPNLTTGLNS